MICGTDVINTSSVFYLKLLDRLIKLEEIYLNNGRLNAIALRVSYLTLNNRFVKTCYVSNYTELL